MNSVYVCFNLKSDSNCYDSLDALEQLYSDVYLPLTKFLYANPSFEFTFSFSGPQINFFKRRKNEFISIIKELVNRKQVEVLGGGFYDPILPLLYTFDRAEQIDLLSADVRQNFGKRPRGVTLFGDCWDSSLINTFQSCGIEYVFLDSEIIPSQKLKFLPLYMTELNKSVEIYPTYDELKPDTNLKPEDFIHNIYLKLEKAYKKDSFYQFNPDRIVNIKLSFDDVKKLFENKWFEKLSDYLKNQNPEIDKTVKLTTVCNFRKNAQVIRCPAYVPAGMSGAISRWISSKSHNSMTVYDFMEKYPQSKSLYNRIMYVNMLINQYKNDSMRKKSARERLWIAQNGAGLLCSEKGSFQTSVFRQKAYKTLLEAEKMIRDDETFEESITCFDYNCDGSEEYICRMKNYFSYISLVSGAIQELEILKNTGNYADNLSRELEFDGCNDNYERGLFIDHIFAKNKISDYLSGEPSQAGGILDGVFSRIQYQELKHSRNHHEVQLYAEGVINATKQKVSLRKKYVVSSDGMYIQYILKNESEKNLDVDFAVESNLAHTNFDASNITYYNVDVVNNEQILKIDPSKSTAKLSLKNKLDSVDFIRITDTESGESFGFEPNECCSFFYTPVLFKRPDFISNKVVPVSMTFVSTLFWHINLEPGKETERTINFTITPVKKEKRLAGKQ